MRKRAGSSATPSSSSKDDSSGGEDSEQEKEEEEKEEEEEAYLPAYMLSDWSMERAGRGERKIDTLTCELRCVFRGLATQYDRLSAGRG